MPTPPLSGPPDFGNAVAATRQGRSVSLHALQVTEYALSAPAPRRERTWIHRLAVAVDALADAVDRQIQDNDSSVSLLAEIGLSEPEYTHAVIDVRNEQRALRVAIESIREQLDDDADFPIDTTNIRERLAKLANWYRQHQIREAELIYAALGIDVTDPPHQL